jgi:hypothetical protein
MVREKAYRNSVRKLKRKDHLGYLCIAGTITLK